MRAATRFCRSSVRRGRCSRGRSLRGCRTRSPRCYGPHSSQSLFCCWSRPRFAAAAGRLASFPFLAILALAVAFGPVTSDLALGQLALPAFAGATLVVLVAGRSLPSATAAACFAFAQPNASLGLASQLGRNRATLAIRARRVRDVCARGARRRLDMAARVCAHSCRARRCRTIRCDSTQSGFDRVRLRCSAACRARRRGRGDAARDCGRSDDCMSGSRRFCALRRVFSARAICRGLLPRARSRRGLRRDGVVRVANARGGSALVAPRRNVAGLRRLARARAASDGHCAERTARARGAVRFYCGWQRRRSSAGRSLSGLRSRAFSLPPPPGLPFAIPRRSGPTRLERFTRRPARRLRRVWAAEQRASGLLAAIPAWALLRSLSLLGCALLAYAIYRHSSCCRTA